MAGFKFSSIKITKIDDENNLFEIIIDTNSKSFLLDY